MAAVTNIISCAYNPKKLTPHFIDPDRMTTREYHVTQTQPEIVFEYSKENELKKAVIDNGGLLCLPVPQALEIKRKYESYVRSKNPNTNSDVLKLEQVLEMNYPKSIYEELEILNGIKSW